MRRAATALICACALLLGRGAARAQQATLPAALQAELIGKILTFDRSVERYGSTITIGIVYQADNRSSVTALRQLTRAFDGNAVVVPGVRVTVRPVAVESELPAGLRSRADVLVLTPLRAVDVLRLADEATASGLLTISAHPEYERAGPAISLVVREARPHIVLDLPRARLAGSDFDSRLLRLVEVVE